VKVKTDIPIGMVKKVSNVRNENVDIEDLKNSIEQHGLLQPIVVSRTKGGYQIVAGHRRFLACQALGLETIPAVIKEFKHPDAVQLTENIQRTNMSKQEESKAVAALKERMDCSNPDLCRMLGKDLQWVHKRIRFHEVREYLIQENFPSKSVAELTYDIALRMGKHKKSLWRKMAAASLGKKWYPEQLDTLFSNIANPTARKKSDSKSRRMEKSVTDKLAAYDGMEFSIDANDESCIMKLLFVNPGQYKQVKKSLIDAGGECI